MRDIVLFTAIDFHMPPICSPIVRPGRPAEAAPVISKQLSDTILRHVSMIRYIFFFGLPPSPPLADYQKGGTKSSRISRLEFGRCPVLNFYNTRDTIF